MRTQKTSLGVAHFLRCFFIFPLAIVFYTNYILFTMDAIEKTALFEYQREGVELICNKFQDVLLADHPGAGKTRQAICAADRLNAQNIIVVCPASLRENWKREFAKWSNIERPAHCVFKGGDAIRCGITIVSYELAGGLKNIPDYELDLLILDEAHYLKNQKSKRTKVIFNRYWPNAKKRIAITGTPLPNGRAIEAYALFSHLAPKHFGNFWQFTNTYCVKEVTRFGTNWNRSKNLESLGNKARELFMIRRKKEETLGQLPRLVRMQRPLTGVKIRDIENDCDVLRGVEEEPSSPKFVSLRRMLGMAKVGAAYKYIMELLKEVERVVVFVHHVDVMVELRAALEYEEVPLVSVSGNTSPQERQDAIDAFQAGGVNVFLGSLLACNTGITLTAAHDVVFVEYDWVPENNIQAEGRCYRIGQTEVTRSHYLCIPDSLDDKITGVILKKQRDVAMVMGDK